MAKIYTSSGYAYQPKSDMRRNAINVITEKIKAFYTPLTKKKNGTYVPISYTVRNGGAAYLFPPYNAAYNGRGGISTNANGYGSTMFGCYNLSTYSDGTGIAYDKPTIVYIEYMKFSDYTRDGVDRYHKIGPLILSPNDTTDDVTGFTNELIIPEFKQDAIIPTNIVFYDNSNDGKYDEYNVRTALPDYDLHMIYDFSEIGRIVAGGKLSSTITNKGTCSFSFRSQFRITKDWIPAAQYSDNTFIRQQAYPLSVWMNSELTGDCIAAVDSGGNVIDSFVMFNDLQTFCNAIADWGIPFTFDKKYATTYNSQKFPDGYKPTGQPSNPQADPNGDGDNTQDPMTLTTPTMSPIGTMAHQYAVSASELKLLSNYLWGSVFMADVRRLWENPAELIVSCVYYPFDLEQHDSANVGVPTEYLIGNVTTPGGTTGCAISTQYNKKIGSYGFLVSPYYGNFLDYEPYTKIEIYLPYIGYKPLSANDCVGKTLTINYYVDISQGKCLAQVFADTRLLGSYTGDCGYNIPMSNSNAVQAATGAAVSGISGIATVAAGIVDVVATKGAATAATAGGSAAAGAAAGGSAALGAAKVGAGALQSTAGVIQAAQLKVDRGGGLPSDLAAYEPQDIYISITKPVTALPSNLTEIAGAPASFGGKISDFTGFLQCAEIYGSTSATAEENALIADYLRGGVYI